MKLWEGDLGATECKKIAVWTYNKQSFQYYGPNLYYQGESGDANVHASFIAENLLDAAFLLIFRYKIVELQLHYKRVINIINFQKDMLWE